MMNKKVLSFLILLLSMMVWVESAIASDSTQEIKNLFKGFTPEEVENFDLSKGDSFFYEAAKMAVGTFGLIDDIESSAGYDIALEAAPIVLDTFTKKMRCSMKLIDSKAWSINLRGKGTSAGAKKAVKTMTDQINKLSDVRLGFCLLNNFLIFDNIVPV
ncbi:MAG: hypothetical protein HUN05_04065 [Desulfobacter sp.]|nr:MAG: hypothetical protein HUN05_04065 [Desulfobacter sp.]